jgi:hypothetical protein
MIISSFYIDYDVRRWKFNRICHALAMQEKKAVGGRDTYPLHEALPDVKPQKKYYSSTYPSTPKTRRVMTSVSKH